MKKFPCIILLFMLLACVAGASAQTRVDESVQTIFDNLQMSEPGKGEVIINQPQALRNMIGVRLYGENVEKTDSTAFLKIQGFRAQVFSGNEQRKSKDEAFEKEKKIKDFFPGVPTYVSYTAPFWKLRVGDFRSHEEAYHMQRQLMTAFPSFGKEMNIVKEEVKIPLN